MDCRQSFTPDEPLLKRLEAAFRLSDNGGIKHMHELEEAALKDGIGTGASGKDGQLATTATAIARLWKANDDGCDSCNHSGYKGRLGIYEVMTNSPAIQKLIVGGSTSETLEATAIGEHMLTMQLDGFIKALRGETTIEEVLRVTAQH